MKTMNKILGAMIVSAMMTSVAGAADVFVEEVAVAPAPAPVKTWDGLFGGIHTGYGFTGTTVSRTAPGPGPAFSFDNDPDGILGGAQVGYNYQYNRMVFGVIGDISLTGMKDNDVFAGGATITWETEYEWIATLRGRAGWLLNDRVLAYAHGGLAFTDLTTDFTTTGPGPVNGLSLGGTETGWVVGAGVEAAVSDRVTAFAEYSYIDFNSNESQLMPSGRVYTADSDPINAIKIGVNFKLWQPGN